MSRQIGATGATLTGSRPGWSRQLGDFIDYFYEGNANAIAAQAAQAKSDADEYSIDSVGALNKLTVRVQLDAGQADLVTEVRLYANRASKSLYNHPTFDPVSQAERKLIRKAIETNTDAHTTTNPGSWLYELLLDQVESVLMRQPILTRTTTASGRYTFINPDYGIPEYVYSTSQLITGASLATLIDTSLLPNKTSSDPNKTYGWFYWGPEIIGTTGGRKQMIQEWEYGLWDNRVYTFA